jgi:hypothetical protein
MKQNRGYVDPLETSRILAGQSDLEGLNFGEVEERTLGSASQEPTFCLRGGQRDGGGFCA